MSLQHYYDPKELIDILGLDKSRPIVAIDFHADANGAAFTITYGGPAVQSAAKTIVEKFRLVRQAD